MRNRIALLIVAACVCWQCQPAKENSTTVEENTAVGDAQLTEPAEGADASFLEKKSRDGVDFYAVGNEPSWSLDIFQQNMISFKSMTEIAELNTPKVEPTDADDKSVLSYKAEVESGSITIDIKSEECTDPMSGEKFPYSVAVEAKNGNMAEFKSFNGCGRYVPDYRLSGVWNLLSIKGEDLTETEKENQPILELDISDMKASGSNGCNRVMGGFSNEGTTLTFPMLAGTRMACRGDLDMRVDQVLNEVSTYEIEDDKLSMRLDDEVLAVWVRGQKD
ncbi:MAG: META domain-containing protein [Cyclobacteriaceae bacterium]